MLNLSKDANGDAEYQRPRLHILERRLSLAEDLLFQQR